MTPRISAEILDTLAKGGPVVALESTLITHGFPYPENLNIARESEAAVRAGGAVPATIAVIDGHLHVGLTDAELASISEPRTDIIKAATRDLPLAIAHKRTAGTTVAATMHIAALAGIQIHATGGIGGVHRGVETSWDISADMTELARTRVCVVCAGAKSLLDLPKTLEVLETASVPVIGYGTDELPAFYTRTSGLKLEARADTPQEVAAIIRAHMGLKLVGGLLVVNPLPEDEALPAEEMNRHIEAGCALAEQQGITGKAATPFLLKYLVKATEGRTLAPNKALIRANCTLGAQIAVSLSGA